MKFGGLLDVARSGLAHLLRLLSRVPVWFGTALSIGADLADPAMPETIWRPHEWMPRLWDRSGGRTPNEARD